MPCSRARCRLLIAFHLLLTSNLTDVSATDRVNTGPLAWKFKLGQELVWTLDQTIQMRAPQGGQMVEGVFKTVVDFNVRVAAVEDERATLNVVTSRVRFESSLPDGKMTYDSAVKKKKKNSGNGGDKTDDTSRIESELLAEMLTPLRDLKFSATVNKNCHVQSVNIDEDVLQSFKSLRPLQAYMIVFDKEGFSSAYLGGFVKTPPDGQTWKSTTVSNTASLLGRAVFEHSYRPTGTAMVDDRELQKYSAIVEMKFDGDASPVIKLGKQTGSGELLFDRQLGRVHSSQWSLTTQILFDGAKAEGEMKLTTKSQISESKSKEAND